MKRLTLGFLAALSGLAPLWAADTHVLLHYTGYVHGIPVLSFSISREQSGNGYGIGIEYHTTGLYGFFFPVKREIEAQGYLAHGMVEPRRYEMNGQARGHVYHAVVTFGDGLPRVDNESPHQDDSDPRDRFLPVPPQATAHTTDYVSAVLGLLRKIASQGNCDGDTHLYDGRTVTDMRSSTEPDEMVQPGHGGIYAGLAHKCRFTGDVLAGGPVQIGSIADERAREKLPPPFGEAWIAPIGPNGQMELVRVAYTTQNGSTMTMVLDRSWVQNTRQTLASYHSAGTAPDQHGG